jgi:hypothetical protein
MNNARKTLATFAAAAAAFAVGSGFATSALAADVGVSVQINQPGVYGRIDIGRFPQPQVVVQQPVIIQRPASQIAPPVYLWVPPGHRRDWRHHCAEYRACGVPVYFVRDDWYGRNVRGHERENFAERREDRREDRRDDRHDERHDNRRDHGRGGHRD